VAMKQRVFPDVAIASPTFGPPTLRFVAICYLAAAIVAFTNWSVTGSIVLSVLGFWIGAPLVILAVAVAYHWFA